MPITIEDVDKQLRALCERRDHDLTVYDFADLIAVTELIDGWLTARATLQGVK